MKLTKEQIDVIIQTQTYKIKIAREIERKEQKSNKNTILLAKKYCELGNKIPQKIRKNLYVDKFTESAMIDAIIQDIPFKIKSLDSENLRRKIILYSIDCSNLDELKAKLKIEF